MLKVSPSSTTAPAPSTRCRSSTGRSTRPSLGKIKGPDGEGLLSYDPAFLNTASCRSAITYIDGDAGILRYRGYPIEQVAEQAGFLETAYLAARGRAADRRAAAALDGRRAHPHLRAHEHRGVHGGLPLRRAPDGDAARRRRRALDVLPGREEHPRSGEPLPPACPADREAADDRGLHLPPQPRPARTCCRATTSTTSATSST